MKILLYYLLEISYMLVIERRKYVYCDYLIDLFASKKCCYISKNRIYYN